MFIGICKFVLGTHIYFCVREIVNRENFSVTIDDRHDVAWDINHCRVVD